MAHEVRERERIIMSTLCNYDPCVCVQAISVEIIAMLMKGQALDSLDILQEADVYVIRLNNSHMFCL